MRVFSPKAGHPVLLAIFLVAHYAKKEVAMPSRLIDDTWHQFTLFTDEYSRFCSVTDTLNSSQAIDKLLIELESRGIQLSIYGGLEATGKTSNLTDDLKAEVERLKHGLMAQLSGPSTPSPQIPA